MYLSPEDLSVKVKDPADGGDGQVKQLSVVQGMAVEVVVQRAQGVVVSHEPELSDGVAGRHVRADVAQDVLVTEEHRTAQDLKVQNSHFIQSVLGLYL